MGTKHHSLEATDPSLVLKEAVVANVQARTAGVTQSREKEVALSIAVRKGWIFLYINQPLTLSIAHYHLSSSSTYTGGLLVAPTLLSVFLSPWPWL